MQISELRDLVAAGMKWDARNIKPDPEPEEKVYRADLQAMLEAAEKYDPRIKHNKPDYDKKLSDEDKKRLCSRNSGIFAITKLPDGKVKIAPRNCNLCERCYRANAGKLKERVQEIAVVAQQQKENGQWRKKTVGEDTEAQSLKKHIKRNQDGAHFEIASEQAGKSEVWTYVEDEPNKDMDEIYGEPAQLEDINYDDLYKRNRETGKKLSAGSAFKRKAIVKKEDTERLMIPEVIVKNIAQQDEAARIIEETNYIEEAKDADHAKRLFIYQFKFILKELEIAGIEIAAIKMNFYNMAKEELLNSWNKNIKYWMSINASLQDNKEANMDSVAHLTFGNISKAEVVH